MSQVSGVSNNQYIGGATQYGGRSVDTRSMNEWLSQNLSETGMAIVDETQSQIRDTSRRIDVIEAKIARLDRLSRFSPFFGHILAPMRAKLEEQLGELKGQLGELKGTIASIQKEAEKQLQDLKHLDAMLANGDIEGAIMMVQTNRTNSLDKQIEDRIRELQKRNGRIELLNRQIADIQPEGDDGKLTPDQEKLKTELKGEIDKLNADSQLDTIKLQSLVNKRNHALEMLTNLLQKFQKVLDGIVANMR